MSPKHLTFLSCGLAFALALPLAAGPGRPTGGLRLIQVDPHAAPPRATRSRIEPRPARRPARAATHGHPARAKAPRAPQRPVDLNTATVTELMQLPKVGQHTAERIVAFRREHGGFKRPEELMGVKGIGEKSFAKLKPYLLVAPASR